MYIYIVLEAETNIFLRGGRSPKVSLGVRDVAICSRVYSDWLGFILVNVLAIRVVLGFAHGCFRVYLGSSGIDLGLDWVSSGFIEGWIILVFLQGLANYGEYVQDTLQKGDFGTSLGLGKRKNAMRRK